MTTITKTATITVDYAELLENLDSFNADQIAEYAKEITKWERCGDKTPLREIMNSLESCYLSFDDLCLREDGNYINIYANFARAFITEYVFVALPEAEKLLEDGIEFVVIVNDMPLNSVSSGSSLTIASSEIQY